MGELKPLRRPASNLPEVYEPINYRPIERCVTMTFDPSDGNRYEELFDAVGIQYALGEREPKGYHVVKVPESTGPLIRYVTQRPNGTFCVAKWRNAGTCSVYSPDEFDIIGLVFQWIRDFETGERLELVRGPAHEGARESTHTLLAMSGHLA